MPAPVLCPRPLPRDEEARRLKANIAWLERRQAAKPDAAESAALARDRQRLQKITETNQGE